MNSKDKRNWIYFWIGLSLIPIIIFPIIFLTTGFFELGDILWVIGAWLGLFGFMLLLWQYILGIKAIAYYFTEDIVFINNLHKTFGIYGFFLILIHPILLFVDFYFLRGINLLNLNLANNFDRSVGLGIIAFLLILFIWLTSHYLRNKFSFRWWKRMHLLNYIILPIAYLHSDDIGTFFASKPLAIYFKLLLILYIFIAIYRIGQQFGILKYKYKVVAIKKITYDTVQIDLKPEKRYINSKPGQFIELQTDLWGESHPFTIAFFDEVDHTLSICVKAVGPFSKSLQNLQVDKEAFLDGPYGVFTREVYKKDTNKIIIAAGGIGITPFLRLIKFIEKNPNKFSEVILFYGNKTPEDIAFKNEIEEVAQKSNLKVVHVLSNITTDISPYERGFLTSTLLRKYTQEDLPNYQFFICGPPIMMTKMKADLLANKVSQNNLNLEEFSF